MTKNIMETPQNTNLEWEEAHGPIPIRMTNDYLFRALLQRNTTVRKALICSLLHLNQKEVRSVSILNPITLGETIDAKNFILDIKIELNQKAVINLEMQVINEGNWTERSLSYLCRAFDNLNQGQNYEEVRPAVQIGILDFTLFEDSPEFYSTFYFMNVKNHRIYSSKLRLSVLCLTQRNLATEEDRVHHIDHWAALFKATTWEELKMLSKSNPFINEAATTIYQLTQEEKIRQQCEAREDYYRRTAGREALLRQKTAEADQAKAELAQINEKLKQTDIKLEQANSKIKRLEKLLQQHGIHNE